MNDLNTSSDNLARMSKPDEISKNIINYRIKYDKRSKELITNKSALINYQQQYFLLENQLANKLSYENIEKLQEQEQVVKNENSILLNNIKELQKLNKSADKDIENFESKTYYPNLITSLALDVKKYNQKKQENYIKEKGLNKSLSALKFFIDSVAVILEQVSTNNKKMNNQSESRIKSKVITILGENLLFLQDIVNMDDIELERNMLNPEFYEFVNCKIQEVDHVSKFSRNIIIPEKNNEDNNVDILLKNNIKNNSLENLIKIDDNENMDPNMEVDSNENENITNINNDGKLKIEEFTDLNNKKNSNQIFDNDKKLFQIKSLTHSYENNYNLNQNRRIKLNKLNLIQNDKIKKFSQNFGKFHINKNVNKNSVGKEIGINVPKHIFNKYNYLNVINKNVDKSPGKINSSPNKSKDIYNVNIERFEDVKNQNSINIDSILNENLNLDFNNCKDEDFNSLKYKEYLLIEDLNKSLNMVKNIEKINENKIKRVKMTYENEYEKLLLIKEENALYEEEIKKYYELIKLHYEESFVLNVKEKNKMLNSKMYNDISNTKLDEILGEGTNENINLNEIESNQIRNAKKTFVTVQENKA